MMVPIGMLRIGIARLHVDALARHHLVAFLEALRRQDIGELAVLVFDERQEAAAVRIVFEAHHFGRHVALRALEVDGAEPPLVTAATPALGDAAVIVAPAALTLALGERLDGTTLPELAPVDEDELALARRRRLVGFECHCLRPPSSRRSSAPRRG
jgi:hypothetical protein